MTREEALTAIRLELADVERVLIMTEWEKCGRNTKSEIRRRQFRCVVQWHVSGDPYNARNYALAEGYGETEEEAAEACLRALCAKRWAF